MSDETEKRIEDIAQATAQEAQAFVEAGSVLVGLENSWNEQAENVRQEAKILAQMENALDNATMEKPFVAPKEDQVLFDEINSLVQGVNDMDKGWEKANEEPLKHLDKTYAFEREGLEADIDEKIEEEQQERQEQDLRNEIVQDL